MAFTFANGIEIYSEDNSVGLNVTQPRRTMDINGTLGLSQYIFLGTTDNLLGENTGKILINTTNTSISFYNNSTDTMVIPVGNITQRVDITGGIRYNTDTLSFEGYSGSNWGSLGGVKDVDQDTYISAENNPGDDNDELKFFTATNQHMIINSIGNLGLGITNPSVKLHISGTDGIVIPVGNTTERIDVTGTIRYNNQTQQFEGYSGTWGSLGGVMDVDQDTYISAENNPGDDNDELKFYTSGNERLRIDVTGNVGLGTTAVNGKLEIAGDYGSVLLGYESYSEMTSNGAGYGDPTTNSYSIYANGKIAASEFNAISDKRVKEILKERDIKEDLKYLEDVKIYDFKYIDKKFYSSRTKIGFMAQELEEYNKNLVNYSTNFIPNVFKEFDVRTINKEHIVELDKDYDIKENDILKIQVIKTNGDAKMKELTVTKKLNKMIYLSYSKNLSEVTRLFLYGKLVNDFRTVNWEQLIAINTNIIKNLKNENDMLKEKVSNNELQIQYLIERLNKLENPIEEQYQPEERNFNYYT